MNDEAFNLMKNSLSHLQKKAVPVGGWKPTQQEIDELFFERITPETDLPPMQPLFRMFDVPCFYRGELVADCGKAKSGKTFFLSILMSACLTQKALALERWQTDDANNPDRASPEMPPLKVLWLDTEQSQQSTQEILKERIIPLSRVQTLDDQQFFAFNLRGLGFEKRSRMVEVAIHTIEPDICIIDGVKDLMTGCANIICQW